MILGMSSKGMAVRTPPCASRPSPCGTYSTIDTDSAADRIPISTLSTDSDKQTTTLELSSKLKAGAPARLMLFFVGSMNPDMAGFYRSSYKSQSGTQEYMFSTQFEACDARRAFPCFDEPNRKATFSVTISAPEGYDVLSNMPIQSRQEVPGKPGHVEYTFEKSPKMSTYLLA